MNIENTTFSGIGKEVNKYIEERPFTLCEMCTTGITEDEYIEIGNYDYVCSEECMIEYLKQNNFIKIKNT